MRYVIYVISLLMLINCSNNPVESSLKQKEPISELHSSILGYWVCDSLFDDTLGYRDYYNSDIDFSVDTCYYSPNDFLIVVDYTLVEDTLKVDTINRGSYVGHDFMDIQILKVDSAKLTLKFLDNNFICKYTKL